MKYVLDIIFYGSMVLLALVVMSLFDKLITRAKQPPIKQTIVVEYMTDKIDTIDVMCNVYYLKLLTSEPGFPVNTPINNCIQCKPNEYITCGVRRWKILYK